MSSRSAAIDAVETLQFFFRTSQSISEWWIKNSLGPLVTNTGKKPTTLRNSVYKASAAVYKFIVLIKNFMGLDAPWRIRSA
jgi:hypothetical protein